MGSGGFSNPIIGGNGALVYPAIYSPDFVHDVSGWQISKDGSAEFNNLTIRGTFFGLDFIINSLGIFIYSGTPALGNLIGSWAPAAGANDGLGNPFLKDLAVYAAVNTGYANASSTGGIGGNTALLFFPGSTAHVTVNPQVYGASNHSGAANEEEYLALTSGTASGNDDTQLQLISKSADGTIPAVLNFLMGGTILSQLFKTQWNIGVPISCTLGTPSSPSVITNGGWTRIASPFSNGWVSGGGGSDVNGIVYRMNNDGNFEIWLDVINPNPQANSVLTTFSSPFIPQKNQKHEIAGSIAGAVWAQLNTTGQLILVGNTAANAEVNGRCMFYLGAFP